MTRSEPCTTVSRRQQHQSRDLAPLTRNRGRTGTTLCGAAALDQHRIDVLHEQQRARRRVVVTSLPRCKHCDRVITRERAAHR